MPVRIITAPAGAIVKIITAPAGAAGGLLGLIVFVLLPLMMLDSFERSGAAEMNTEQYVRRDFICSPSLATMENILSMMKADGNDARWLRTIPGNQYRVVPQGTDVYVLQRSGEYAQVSFPYNNSTYTCWIPGQLLRMSWGNWLHWMVFDGARVELNSTRVPIEPQWRAYLIPVYNCWYVHDPEPFTPFELRITTYTGQIVRRYMKPNAPTDPLPELGSRHIELRSLRGDSHVRIANWTGLRGAPCDYEKYLASIPAKSPNTEHRSVVTEDLVPSQGSSLVSDGVTAESAASPEARTDENNRPADVSEIAGNWQGQISQPSAIRYKSYALRLEIASEVAGNASGSTDYSGMCQGTLTYKGLLNGRFHFDEIIRSGSGCMNGTVTLEKRRNVLRYTWESARGPEASGELHRVQTPDN